MRYILLFCLFQLPMWCIAQNPNRPVIKSDYLPYKTVPLSKGYKLVFESNNDLRILRLIGPSIDTILLSKKSIAAEKYLGWLMADYDDYFVMYYGESHSWLRIFKKETGELMLAGMDAQIDSVNHKFYAVSVDDKRNLCLFDGYSGKIELFRPPKTPCSWWFECIISKKLTDKDLTIVYADYNNKRETKVYMRQ